MKIRKTKIILHRSLKVVMTDEDGLPVQHLDKADAAREDQSQQVQVVQEGAGDDEDDLIASSRPKSTGTGR